MLRSFLNFSLFIECIEGAFLNNFFFASSPKNNS
jgi:hypothetical protein